MKTGLQKVFSGTKFKAPHMVATSAGTGDIKELLGTLSASVKIPKRTPEGPFHFAVDHCFPIKGQGTVLTGTVLNGTVKVNDNVELPELRVEKKVKSMQMFKKPVKQVGVHQSARPLVIFSPPNPLFSVSVISITLYHSLLAFPLPLPHFPRPSTRKF
jgi:predicted membrane GTPase involved in stress response